MTMNFFTLYSREKERESSMSAPAATKIKIKQIQCFSQKKEKR
jgi:hypothetical protein